jgi:hypothetical protein
VTVRESSGSTKGYLGYTQRTISRADETHRCTVQQVPQSTPVDVLVVLEQLDISLSHRNGNNLGGDSSVLSRPSVRFLTSF